MDGGGWGPSNTVSSKSSRSTGSLLMILRAAGRALLSTHLSVTSLLDRLAPVSRLAGSFWEGATGSRVKSRVAIGLFSSSVLVRSITQSSLRSFALGLASLVKSMKSCRRVMRR